MDNGSTGEEWYPSRWGPTDVLGAVNLMTPDSVRASLALVARGRIYDLSHVLHGEMPVPSLHGQFFANTNYTLENGVEWHERNFGEMMNGYSAQNLRISMSDHSGTHIDQLNHVGIRQPDGDFLLYNGIRNRDVVSSFGTTKLGAEELPPLICRGILVDVAKYLKVEMLPAGYAISPEELDSALADQGVTVEQGDAVLVHTGWGKNWDDPEKMHAGEPGLAKACASWAVTQNIICWGTDQFGTDPIPFETPGEALPMHQEMLTKNGIRLIENIRMDEIVQDEAYAFCLIAAPLKIKGGTGSPVRLLALV
jgi:kynurenine formamidase